jgi:hypothetical protein
MGNAPNDLIFVSVEQPADILPPRICSVSSPVAKKATSTVSLEMHKGAIIDRLKIHI